jgi:drug/metabolite transporter (DMT)-like permease
MVDKLKNNTQLLGILLALLGAISLSIMGEFVKMVGPHISDGFILFARFFLSFLFLIPFILKDKTFSFKVVNMKGLLLRSIFGFVAMMCFFQTLRSMSAANAMLLINTAPVFVPFVVYAITRVKTNLTVMFGIVISVFGVAIIIKPTSGVFDVVILIGLASGFFASIATVLLRVVGKQNSPNQMMFYYFLYCAIMGLVAGVIYWQPLSVKDFIILTFVGIFGVLYQFGLTYALKFTQVRIVSPIMLSAIVFSGLLDWLFRDDTPKSTFVIGAFVLVVGILWVVIFINSVKNQD